VITPRRTRLVRVPDLHSFRGTIQTLCAEKAASAAKALEAALVVVPTRSAARELEALLGDRAAELVTRDQLYDALQLRLLDAPRRLSAIERDSIAQASAAAAAAAIDGLSFQVRPGLVSEMLRFYDQLRRQSQQVDRFEELTIEALGGDAASDDRGAARQRAQTRFLAAAFREYERRLSETGALDEHALRARLIAEVGMPPRRHIIVTTADWIADPDGLYAADFDLLSRLPGLELLEMVCTEAILASGFEERLHDRWPGLEVVAKSSPRVRPRLITPSGVPDQLWFTHRDREEELLAVARITSTLDEDKDGIRDNERTAVVFKRPLPYLYLAPETLGAFGVRYQASDALPLASEPAAASLDLVLELVETNFVRSAIVALLRSPHFEERGPTSSESSAALDAGLSEARYLGDLPSLESIVSGWRSKPRMASALPAADAALRLCHGAATLLERATASTQIEKLTSFLRAHWRVPGDADPLAPRERRGRTALIELLETLAAAHRAHHDPEWGIDDLAGGVRRWIGEQTFAPEQESGGLHLLDDQSARYGEFDDIAIVGVVENEWPDRPRPNIFYPVRMLRSLGWPSERDRSSAAVARFLDLVASASRSVTLSTFTLDDDLPVVRSAILDEIPKAGLSAVKPELEGGAERSPRNSAPKPQDDLAARWLEVRRARPPFDASEFHGSVGPQPRGTWTVSALETYLTCPFKFFALHVLKLREDPDDEEVMDPRRQGILIHKVFESFFRAWQAQGGRAITRDNLDEARALFEVVVDEQLSGLSRAEAGLERTRLLGSPAAAGLGEAVFRMEAEREIGVVQRLLEHPLEGTFTIATADGPREVRLRGKADRLDLLEDGSFRLIDYKLGWPPNRGRALQLPIYAVCAEQGLAGLGGRSWTLGEAAYLAFKGPKRVVPLFTTPPDRDKALSEAQQRLTDTIDAIERGEFPPTPEDVYRCESCSAASVCRKDYVGDVRT
jgi:RecB family exonuclease/inactivated superfamily I helicase